jgi:hypothetical protein
MQRSQGPQKCYQLFSLACIQFQSKFVTLNRAGFCTRPDETAGNVLVREDIAAGMDEREAHYAARRAFGMLRCWRSSVGKGGVNWLDDLSKISIAFGS